MMSRIPRKKKKLIPSNTPYCYEPTGETGMTYSEKYKTNLPYYGIKRCPYYKHIDGLEGYCKLMECEVMDQVKECGLKTDR
jgi:hypothetical protein